MKVFSKILSLLVVFFSMLIKIELQMAFRSAQKRPRSLQDARPPPTWSQHGANMGSKRGAKIGPRALEIWSRRDLRSKSLSDLNMDPNWTPTKQKNSFQGVGDFNVFPLFVFLQNLQNWPLAYTRPRFWHFKICQKIMFIIQICLLACTGVRFFDFFAFSWFSLKS